MTISWKQYQEEAAAFFRSLGLSAETDVRVQGVRTAHDVDVLVKSNHVGFEVRWLVECKHWKTAISKLHVLALREIVSDTGADRGIILAESGFQSGAVEAANLTNVQLTSLATLSDTATIAINAMQLRELFDRVESCNERYWDIPKEIRIERGLRPEVGDAGYSAAEIISYCKEVLSRALRGAYPFEADSLVPYLHSNLPRQFNSSNDAVKVLERLVGEMEAKL